MPDRRPLQRPASIASAVLLCLFVVACAAPPPVPPPPPPPPQVEAPPPPEPVEVVVETPPAVPPEPVVPPPPPPPPPPPVALVISSDIEAYHGVEQALIHQLGEKRARIFEMRGTPERRDAVLAGLATAEVERVIAVGFLAATVVAEANVEYKVFCQILNFEPHDLLRSTSGGIKLLPPFQKQLVTWQSLSPELESVGVILGPDQDALLDEIRQATADLGIRLHAQIARSDKEALYAFKRMTPQIDGFWLLPDNRILSPGVIREIMAYGAKHEKQIVVFNDKLLSLGALMSVSADPQDVADRALELLARAERGEAPVVLPLNRMQIRINRSAADRLGIVAPELSPDLASLR